jgi:hypothetical protein
MDYGRGRLADAIRAAMERPFNDHGDPGEYPTWEGAEATYRLHVHRETDASLRWVVEVRHRSQEFCRAWLRRMAQHCLAGLGTGDTKLLEVGDDYGVWARACSPLEVREIEGDRSPGRPARRQVAARRRA